MQEHPQEAVGGGVQQALRQQGVHIWHAGRTQLAERSVQAVQHRGQPGLAHVVLVQRLQEGASHVPEHHLHAQQRFKEHPLLTEGVKMIQIIRCRVLNVVGLGSKISRILSLYSAFRKGPRMSQNTTCMHTTLVPGHQMPRP